MVIELDKVDLQLALAANDVYFSVPVCDYILTFINEAFDSRTNVFNKRMVNYIKTNFIVYKSIYDILKTKNEETELFMKLDSEAKHEYAAKHNIDEDDVQESDLDMPSIFKRFKYILINVRDFEELDDGSLILSKEGIND